jgi:hypothetical protein
MIFYSVRVFRRARSRRQLIKPTRIRRIAEKRNPDSDLPLWRQPARPNAPSPARSVAGALRYFLVMPHCCAVTLLFQQPVDMHVASN